MTTTSTTAVKETPSRFIRIEPNKLDWLDHFQKHGYAVVKGAIPVERARAYQQRAFDWVKSFGTAFDVDKPETWTKENLPVQSQINTFAAYGVAHEKFMWDARMEPGVLAAFAELWGTDELLVSFDALNITFPNRKDKPRKEPWPHIDQSPLRKGLQCAQGVICLSDSGPEDGGLLVYPDSHLLTEEFFETQTDKATWKVKDGYGFTEEQVKWYTDRGIKTHKVCAEAGDLLIWDSRTIHWGTEPTEKGNTIRTVIYASYAPAALASAETLEKKAEVFRAWESTTHWAHDNIVFKKTEAKLDDGSIDPRSRDEPREKPELSDKLLRLAGAKAY